MGITTEHERPPGQAADPGGPAARGGPAVLRCRSVLPSRRAVLHVGSLPGLPAADDLVRWYTERGFHFYVTALRPPVPGSAPPPAGPGAASEPPARLDAACAQLRDQAGISSVIVSAQHADAAAVALWCDTRRDQHPADALILHQPEFGRDLREGLRIPCPVLVLGDGAAPPSPPRGKRGRKAWREAVAPPVLGPHVTWLWLPGGPDPAARRQLFDELGRWLGAYMYTRPRDQLL
jgi:hypothetical protein